MIESVLIKDFQSIEDVEIEFAPGFNVLVGPSNSGKSAVLRALRGAIRNEIAPSFVRNGTRKATIFIDFGDHSVSAERGKSLSTYHLDTQEFTKCGKDVPHPILDVLQMNLVNDQDLHFQFQFDSPFLLSTSGSTIAQVIGTLTNVTLLFHAVQEANRRYLRASSELTIRLNDIEGEKNKAGQFAHIEKRSLLVPTLEQKVSKYKEYVAALVALTKLTTEVIRVQNSIPDKIDLPDLTAEFDQYHELDAAYMDLTQTISKIASTHANVGALRSRLSTVDRTLSTMSTEFCPTCGQKLPESGRMDS